MAVKFTQSTQVGALYNKGEIAGFDPKTEEDLIKAKVAVEVKSKNVKPDEGSGSPVQQ